MDFVEIPYADRHHVDDLADFYAVIVAIDRIERAFHRDLIAVDTYEATLRRLMQKYQTLLQQLQQTTNSNSSGGPQVFPNSLLSSSSLLGGIGEGHSTDIFDVDRFWAEYASKCTAARQRIRVGHPADVTANEKAAAALASSQQQAAVEAAAAAQRAMFLDPKLVLECAQYFITLMDSLKLQQTAVDQLFPILTDLVMALRRIPNGKEKLPVAMKLETWRERMSQMHPSDELGERDTREIAFDLERGYQEFYHYLSIQQQQPTAVRVGA